MKTNILVVTILTLTVIAIGCVSQYKTANDNSRGGMDHNSMDHSNMNHSVMKSSSNAANAPYDLQFLDTMNIHHQGAVEMAKGCGEKAAKAEIKKLCSDIISSQTKEIEQMRAWRESWFKGSGPAINMQLAGMPDSMKDMDMKKLGSLNGVDYDLEFIRQMIPHHVGAVEMAKEALVKSSRPEIKTLAEAIIQAQNAEIKQMNAWQTAWMK